MTTVLLIATWLAYSAIAHYFWRRWAWEFKQDWINTRNEAMFFGLCAALVWPFVFAWKTVVHSETFMLPPPAVRQREREAALQARVAELERELELR